MRIVASGACRTVFFAALLAGCAAPRPAPEPGERPAGGVMTAAGESLLAQGRAERRDGELALASMTLERAIRIEPAAPGPWLELARVRLDEGDYGQAEQLARKAGSLLAPDDPLTDAVEEVITDALRRQGRSF